MSPNAWTYQPRASEPVEIRGAVVRFTRDQHGKVDVPHAMTD